MTNDNSAVCCPEFHTERWDGKTLQWDKKHFLRETLLTFFHIPFPPMIGKKMTKLWNLAKGAHAEPPLEECLFLFRDPTPFRSELFMSVTKPVEGAANADISGTFAAKVFDGPYNAVPKFIEEMNTSLASQGKKAKDYYIHYAYCPKCAKKYGHNHMILFAEV